MRRHYKTHHSKNYRHIIIIQKLNTKEITKFNGLNRTRYVLESLRINFRSEHMIIQFKFVVAVEE